jgi:hypothetical protein
MTDGREPVEAPNGLRLRAGGVRVAATGREVVVLIVLALGFALVVLSLRDLRADLVARGGEHQQLFQAQQALICILALPLEHRAAAVRYAQGGSGTICDYVVLRGGIGPEATPMRR